MVLVYGRADSCLYNKQNHTWTLGDMELILSSRVHIRYLTRSVRSLVRYGCEHFKINSIFPRAHVLFSIYLLMIMGHYFMVLEAPVMHECFSAFHQIKNLKHCSQLLACNF